jgi:hypothetical protein
MSDWTFLFMTRKTPPKSFCSSFDSVSFAKNESGALQISAADPLRLHYGSMREVEHDRRGLRSVDMRNEDYDRELLAAVTLICATIAVGASLLDPSSPAVAKSIASAQSPARLEQVEPVRVVGTPFVPNTNPRER